MKTKHGNNILLCLFEVIVGILLLIEPVSFTTGIIVAAGVVLAIAGIVSIIRYFRTEPQEAALSRSLANGLICVVAGVFCALKSHWFVATFPVLTIVYGVAILLAGLQKVQLTIDLLRFKRRKWFLAAISAVLSIVCSIVILSSPFASTAALWMFTGISLIVEAVVDLVSMIFNAREAREENHED